MTVNAVTAESLGINGQNAENASKKRTPKQTTKTRNSQPNPLTPKKLGPNTTPNWCAKSVAKWDTPPEIAITETRRRQPTEASRTPKQSTEENNSEEILDKLQQGL